MGVFEQFPYTNFHDLNLDWLLKLMKKLDKKVDDFVLTSTVKYADPFDWNIGTQYPSNTVVGDPATGTAYISVKPVPGNIPITDTEYWTPVFNLQALWDALTNVMESVVPINQKSDTTANQQIENQELFWLDHKLYIATAQIPLNGDIVIGSNCRTVTIEELLLQAQSYLTSRINTNANNIEKLENNVNTLNVTTVKNKNTDRKFIFIGDSIANGYSPDGAVTGWPYRFASINGLTLNSSVWVFAANGAGVTIPGNNYIGLFNSGILSLSDEQKNSITDVVIAGTVNDIYVDLAATQPLAFDAQEYQQKLTELLNAIKNNCPYAKIWLLPIVTFFRPLIAANINNMIMAMQATCNNTVVIHRGLMPVMHDRSNFSSDNLHPNQTGLNYLASLAISILSGGTPTYITTTKQVGFTPTTDLGRAFQSNMQIFTKIENESIRVLTHSILTGSGTYNIAVENNELGTINGDIIGTAPVLNSPMVTASIPVVLMLHGTTSDSQTATFNISNAVLTFQDGKVYLNMASAAMSSSSWASPITTADHIAVGTGTQTLSIYDC